ncbi:MAG: hypothetical protein IJK32_01840 [Bacteroidales bacterium]|nr:hypothetical protein [Bacteroidales bacterium]
MKKSFSIVALATIFSFGLAAQNNFEFGEDADFSIRKGVFSAEPVSYVAFGDHNLLDVDADFQNNKGKALTEFYMNIIELRVHPYESGMFTLGVDFDWDYYRLRNTYFWQPDASKEKVSIASMEGSGFKRIKKSRLSVRTLSVPIAFEQSFDKFTLRIGAAGEYNFPAISRFKGESRDGATVKEWKDGDHFSKQIKTKPFTYNIFVSLSFGGIGVYVKYSPVTQFEQGYGPQFKSLTFGVISGIGM